MSSAIYDATRYHRYSFEKIKPFIGEKVLEIGCGLGTYTELMLDYGCTVLANDLDQEAIEICEDKFQGRQVSFVAGDISEPGIIGVINLFQPDSLVMIQVLEHIENDHLLLQTLAGIGHSRTKLVVIVPALQSLYGPMDSDAGHFRRYGKHDLANIVRSTGWEVDYFSYFNPVGAIGWWVNNRLMGRWTSLNSRHVNAQIKLFDRLVLPLSRGLEKLTGGFFGQSLVLAASKTEKG